MPVVTWALAICTGGERIKSSKVIIVLLIDSAVSVRVDILAHVASKFAKPESCHSLHLSDLLLLSWEKVAVVAGSKAIQWRSSSAYEELLTSTRGFNLFGY